MNLLFTLLQSSIAALLVWIALGPGITPKSAMPQPQRGEGYWHTNGNQILDASGNPVRIAGINWYGLETANAAPGGLDLQDYKAILATIRKNGYNTIRIPFSSQIIESPAIPISIRFSNHGGPINADLRGLNSLQLLDKIIFAAGSAGLKVILDNHRSEAGTGPEANGLWYTDAYPESSWIADWQMLARRYKHNPTVIGFDLRNEPHNANSGGACWGCGGDYDWQLAAQRAGNAVLAVNSRLLIFVEGTDTYEDDSYWWGGNLEGVATAPVRLSVPNQLVYSAHDYGPAEYGQPWLTRATTPETLNAVWTRHWAYISDRNIAPVWLGEFGAQKEDPGAPTPIGQMETRWFKSLVQFLDNNPRINWTYWALNGDDRYGLLDGRYDATPWDSDKQQALTALQYPLNFPTEDNPTPFTEDKLATIQITTITPIKR
jgi:endoglucanase